MISTTSQLQNDEESQIHIPSISPIIQNQSSKLYKETLLKLVKDTSFIENKFLIFVTQICIKSEPNK